MKGSTITIKTIARAAVDVVGLLVTADLFMLLGAGIAGAVLAPERMPIQGDLLAALVVIFTMAIMFPMVLTWLMAALGYAAGRIVARLRHETRPA